MPEEQEPADFTAHVVACSPRLLQLAHLLTGDRTTAEDLVQTAWVKAYLVWPRVRAQGAEAYVRRILVNAHTDWWRRRSRSEVLTARVPELAGEADLAHEAALRGVVLQVLARLNRRERTVIVLRFYQQMTEVEIAHELGCSVGTVKSASSRGLAKLRTDPTLLAIAGQDCDEASSPKGVL